MLKEEKVELVYLFFVTVLLALCWLEGPGLMLGSPLWVRFTYQFVHANIWHLLANGYCIILLAFNMHQDLRSLIISYLISCTVPVFDSVPTVGASGICFALMGWNTWRVADKRKYLLWLAVFLVIGFVVPRFAGFTHFYCALMGMLTGWLWRKR